MSYNYLFRIIILGHPAVGKTSLMHLLSSDRAPLLYHPTIGIDFGTTVTPLLNGNDIKTHLWDTAGQEYFSPIVRTYYRNIAGAMLVYDVTNRVSFERLSYWLNELKEESSHPGKIILLANKIDRYPRVISTEEGEAFAKAHNMAYEEISVRQRTNAPVFYCDFIQSIYDTIDFESDKLPVGIKKYVATHIVYTPHPPPPPTRECCILL